MLSFNDIHLTEFIMFIAMFAHVIIAPCTKVEESFNVQAIHDILYYRFNLSEYDHHDFPGVVPRTFIGPLFVAIPLLPIILAFQWLAIPKYFALFTARFALGGAVLVAFLRFVRSIEKRYGSIVATFLRVITASQFHFMFYCSRPLPNTFALIGVLWVCQKFIEEEWMQAAKLAVIFTTLFRCDLFLFFGSLFFWPVITKKIPLFGSNGAIVNSLATVIKTLAVTVPIDSLFWGRWLWPEGEVFWFNVILNRSHEYGTSPFLWYFYSALPRALLCSLVLVPFGILVDSRLHHVALPSIVFVFLYSFLAHKELRFIIYAIPLLNLSAAVFCARSWINRWKTLFRTLLNHALLSHIVVNLVCACIFLNASSKNYPGGEALGYLQHMQRFDRGKPISVYIDNFAAQTGVSRFLQMFDSWEYNKSESLEPVDLARFNFLLIGSYSEKDVVKAAKKNFTSHRPLYGVEAFRKVTVKRLKVFPYLWIDLKTNIRLIVMQKLHPDSHPTYTSNK